MSALELRSDVDRLLDNVDESFLKVVHSMLDTYTRERQLAERDPIVGYDLSGNAKRANETMKLYEEQLKRAEEGDFVTVDQLRENIAKWRSSTK